MGLDFWIEATMQQIEAQVDFGVDYRYNSTEIAYWRKDQQVFDYFKSLYLNRGGQYPEFNCATIKLTEDDINGLADLLKKRDNYEKNQELCNKLLEAVSEYNTVYAYAWY